MRKTITVKYLMRKNACLEAIKAFKSQEEKNTIKVLKKCLERDHFDWANWLIVRLMTKEQNLRYAVYSAKLVLPIYEKEHPSDKRPRKAIMAAKKVLRKNNKQNKDDACYAADAAYDAADAAAYYAAAYAADAAYAANTAYAADAADAAAYYAAYAAYHAAYYAAYAAYHAANHAADDAYHAANDAYAAANDAAYAAYHAADAGNATIKNKIINYGIKLLTNRRGL